MKYCLLVVILGLCVISCKKEVTLTKQNTYRDIVYRIRSDDSNLIVEFMRAVYTETIKGNITTDSSLKNPGLYSISAKVLTGAPVVLYGESRVGPDFYLEIADDQGALLAKTDSITYYKADTLRPYDLWISKLSIIP